MTEGRKAYDYFVYLQDMKHFAVWIGLCAAVGSWLLTGCSTTRVLAPDEALLTDNKVIVVEGAQKDDPYNASSLQPYIKQKRRMVVRVLWCLIA